MLVAGLVLWTLPSDIDGGAMQHTAILRLKSQADWVGALLISVSLALLSYVLVIATGENAGQLMKRPANVTMLCLSLAPLPVLIWARYQTKQGGSELIPKSLRRNISFTIARATVFLVQ